MIELGCLEVVEGSTLVRLVLKFYLLCVCVCVCALVSASEHALPQSSQSPFSTEGAVKLPQ